MQDTVFTRYIANDGVYVCEEKKQKLNNNQINQENKERLYGVLLIFAIIAIVIIVWAIFWIIPAHQEVERTQRELEISRACDLVFRSIPGRQC